MVHKLYKYTRGGRSESYPRFSRDCVARAFALALSLDEDPETMGKVYDTVWNKIADCNYLHHGKRRSADHGVPTKTPHFNRLAESMGFRWVPFPVGTMLSPQELATLVADKTVVVSIKGHVVCVKKGLFYDVAILWRRKRTVYGYWEVAWVK